MEYTLTIEGNSCLIEMNGVFSFSDNSKVKKIIDDVTSQKPVKCTVNLAQMESIDSAGLGMLLLIHDRLQEFGQGVELVEPKRQVLKMLQISKFSEIMPVISEV